MSQRNRQPLSEAEVEFLVQLANGNALARQRRKERHHKKMVRNLHMDISIRDYQSLVAFMLTGR